MVNNQEIIQAIYERITKIDILDKEKTSLEISKVLDSYGIITTSLKPKDETCNKLTAQEQLIEIIDSCTIKKSSKYPYSVFYMDGNKVLLEQDNRNKVFWYSYTRRWLIFESEYAMKHNDIKSLIADTLGTYLKCDGFIAAISTQNIKP